LIPSEIASLLHDPEEAADRRPEDDADAVGLEAVQPRVGDRFLCRTESEQDVPVELARFLRAGDRRRVEVLDLGGDPHGEPARVERADEVDPTLASNGCAPSRRRVVADRRDRPETRHGNPSHAA
jgi:hypothetical protein